jgi:hypothetical protein
MNKKRRLASANASSPGEQFLLVGVSGKSIDGMDRATDRNLFIEEPHVPRSIDDLPRNRANGSKSDEDDRRFFSPQIVPQMVPDSASRTHAGAGHNDCPATYPVDGHRIGSFTGEMQIGYAEGVITFLKQTCHSGIEAFGVALEDLGGRDRHRRIQEDLHGGRQPAALHALVQNVENFLSALECESARRPNGSPISSLKPVAGSKSLVT